MPKKITEKKPAASTPKTTKKKEKDLVTKIYKEKKAFLKRKKAIALGATVVLVLGLAYLARGLFVAVLVNNQPISRLSLVRELEKRQGREVLDSLIHKLLILQEAKKQNISVSQEEIDTEIANIEKGLEGQGQSLDQVLALQNMTRDDLLEQIRLQKLIEKMLADKITVSDEEVDEYIETNKDYLPKDTDPQELQDGVRQQLKQKKLGENIEPWLKELKEKAKINYFFQLP